MLWLQPIPWARWAAAISIAAIALWVELAPDASSDHPFSIVDIAQGDHLTTANVELRQVPSGLLPPAGPGSVATRDIPAGTPIGPGDTASPEAIVPEGWWIVATDLPMQAKRGDQVRIVLLDSGDMVDGVVASVETEDPFEVGGGAVAIPPDLAPEVARAVSEGRMVVLIGTG